MKKRLLTALCSTLAVAAALPALADHQIGGYYRVQGVMNNATANGQQNSAKPERAVDHRFRARWQNNINDYLTVVWFGEVDAPWGEGSKGNIGNAGKQGADGVNVETKNAYLDFKIPNAPYALALRTGAQGIGDNAFNGVVMNDDMSGVKLTGKMDMVDLTAGWFKLDEGASRTKDDDSDLYAIQASLAPVQGLKIMPELWWANNQTTDVSEYYLGVGAAYKLPMVDLSGWFVYDFGTDENPGGDVDISALALSLKAAANVAGANVGARLIYFQNDDDAKDDNTFTPPNANNGAFEFYDEGLTIFLADAAYMNTNGGRLALTDAAYAGYGLLGLVVNGSYTLPANKNVYLKGALGYFQAMDDKCNDSAASEREGTVLGTELSLVAGIKVAEKADVQVRAAYAMLGDFYDNAAAGGDDPENLYKLALMLNVPY